MKVRKFCSNCIRGSSILVNHDILCRDKGAVSPDFVCSKHKFIPASNSIKSVVLKCIDCENFFVSRKNTKEKPNIGLCRLFSVRTFDGTEKKACSKFLKKCENKTG